MMKDILKKKLQHVINIHIHTGKSGKEDEESKKTSDLAPMVEDHGKMGAEGSPQEEMGESYGEKTAEGDIPQNQMVMANHQGPQATADDHRMNMLEDMGAYSGNKNPKGLRGKAMHAAGQELDKLKAKKGLKKS